ncbi:biotin carboxylase N-terminal domain-containing protein [Propionivibrio dicarboxylicus]|uniref:biotin carboxylase n=1 Tax=Propionivibrio dicarboxylicus TaxID=83767 RepID=A0A1G7VIF8_9RHOO|nr:biotin carboxylase N-terminal domain-containing protein [Propionivibrio dicarboxylicus]SDG59606.1 acetyl-CoA carboxylase, biotin carboxylase subunit [Propionivibrio dicarboxylicus]
MFGKILIANRGEVALRILRACRDLGIKTVVAHSEADRGARFLALADQAVCIGPAPASLSYLNAAAILSAAIVSDAEAIHPGYGFLAGSADFAARVDAAGLSFIGARAETLRLLNDKTRLRGAMKTAGIPCIPGPDTPLADDAKEAQRLAKKLGYPVVIKASVYRGERGMRIVHTDAALLNAITQTRAEALELCGSADVYLEKHLEYPRHIEIQMLADQHGNVLFLGERDCSLQRKGHRLIEEAPAFGIPNRLVARIGERCADACRQIGFHGVGGFRFLVEKGDFHFAGITAGLQFEHPLCEMVTGIDLVQEQIRAAAGEKLRFRQRELVFRGHAIECRINAEDPQSFLPAPGKISALHFPGGPGIRCDSALQAGEAVTAHYDPLVAKIIAFGENREHAIRRLRNALDEARIEGLRTNLALHRNLLNDANIQKGVTNLHYLEKVLAIKRDAQRKS